MRLSAFTCRELLEPICGYIRWFMEASKTKVQRRKRRCRHIRKRVVGVSERPRLSVYRSNRNIYAQIINDLEGRTLVAASTKSKDAAIEAIGSNKAAAEKVGELLGQRALQQGIKQLAFDRGGYKFHGRVKALADGVRKAGVKL